MIAYFDSSAVIKLLVRERDWEAVSEVQAAVQSAAASTLVRAELGAALAVKRRAGSLTSRAYDRAWTLASDWCSRAWEVEVDTPIARTAGAIAGAYALRAADAVHLATALWVGAPDLVMVTWDRRLHRAAADAGLAVAPAKP